VEKIQTKRDINRLTFLKLTGVFIQGSAILFSSLVNPLRVIQPATNKIPPIFSLDWLFSINLSMD
jgi:hypothetical protein